MRFHKHNVDGQHAFLGASKYAWLNYTPDKLENVFLSEQAKRQGTLLHEFASQAIKLKIKLPNIDNTLNLFVNDSINNNMASEKVLYYSDYCFGTADAIQFEDGVLKIFDLKTGTTPTKFKQLLIYAALFCLEYKVDYTKIDYDLRIYQYDSVNRYEATQEEIREDVGTIIEKIVINDDYLRGINQRG